VARGCFIISVTALILFLAALSYLFKGDGSAPSTPTPSPPPTALVQAAMPTPSPAATPESLVTPGPLATPDRVSAFERIAPLKDEPRAVWSKTIGRPAESYPPDKHSAGRDTWKIGELKMIIKWGRFKSGLLAEDIDIDATAGAGELSLAEAEQIAIYFGLSNSLITYPKEKVPWFIWHNVDGTPVASFGPESPSLVGGKPVSESKNPDLGIVIVRGKPALRSTPGMPTPGMPGSTPMPLSTPTHAVKRGH
jgi:hypothetical protein